MATGFVFVHGINNSPEERRQMVWKVKDFLAKAGLAFDITRVGEWRSLGSWLMDLEDLGLRQQRREEAVDDVATAIDQARWAVKSGTLVVMGHSMGQVLAAKALKRLEHTGRALPVSVKFISAGGPMGNTSPAFRKYLDWAVSPSSFIPWWDVWQMDDPVCCDFIAETFGQRGYLRPFEHVVPLQLDGCMPDPTRPLDQHGSYFTDPKVANLIRKVMST